MGLCEPGQVGNEAAISSSFQVRWASHQGPAMHCIAVHPIHEGLRIAHARD